MTAQKDSFCAVGNAPLTVISISALLREVQTARVLGRCSGDAITANMQKAKLTRLACYLFILQKGN